MKDGITGPRLWVLPAQAARVAVIFRRGPSREVQMIKWHLDRDSFEQGQWFRGRVYERRCDLSPDGSFLIYFAANWKKPLRSWTAISRPPFFTALALWPKGDAWNGGGYFVDSTRIHLDHFPGEDSPHPDFEAGCRKFRPASLAQARGEDGPVWHYVLRRRGWIQAAQGNWNEYGIEKGYSWKAIAPETWRRAHPTAPLFLEFAIEAIHQENGPWYLIRYRLAEPSGTCVCDLGHLDWADWDTTGDLLLARDGAVFRGSSIEHPGSFREISDFAANKFENVEAPAWATQI
jgi:hypothetical protein